MFASYPTNELAVNLHIACAGIDLGLPGGAFAVIHWTTTNLLHLYAVMHASCIIYLLHLFLNISLLRNFNMDTYECI